MRLGIVGHEAAKFTPEKQLEARAKIRELISLHNAQLVVSGACPLGGIDIWAVEEARALGVRVREFAPTVSQWSGPGGFQDRNLRIAQNSTMVVCLVVRELPSTYTGRVFDYCYHCHTREHIKSGGCWTVKQAVALGKRGEVIVL